MSTLWSSGPCCAMLCHAVLRCALLHGVNAGALPMRCCAAGLTWAAPMGRSPLDPHGPLPSGRSPLLCRPLPFWASWVLFQSLLAALEACLLVGFGYAFGFKLVRSWAVGRWCRRSAAPHGVDLMHLAAWGTTALIKATRHVSCGPPQFTRNAFGLSFLLILLVSLAMTAFGFFVAAFLRKVGPCSAASLQSSMLS